MVSRKNEILSTAQDFIQTKGFNGFSYNNIATKIGIKTSSIHYYFKSKDDLAVALIERYHHNFKLQLNAIDVEVTSPYKKLVEFSIIFKSLAENKDKFCLCGMMAAELQSVSSEAKELLKVYFESTANWISKQFAVLGSKTPKVNAKAYLALLEGALLIARIDGGASLLEKLAFEFISRFKD